MSLATWLFGSSLATILVGVTPMLWGRETSVDLYPINIDSIVADAPSADSLADLHAVYLLKKEDLDIHSDYSLVYTSHVITLITSSEGARLAGTSVIHYQMGYDSVIVNRAKAISPDGTVHEVRPSRILYGLVPMAFLGTDIYTDQREVHINYDGIEVGSIIESVVSVITARPDFPGFSHTTFFGMPSITGLAVVSVRHDDAIDLFVKTRGFYVKPLESQDSGHTTRTWLWRMVPPVVSEPSSVPYGDLAMRVDFTSFQSWAEFGDTLFTSMWYEDLSKPLTSSELSYLERLSLEDLDAHSKLRVLFYAVQDDVRYLGLELGIHNLKPCSSEEVYAQRFGDCKDKANLLVKLVRHAGFDAYPAAVATSDVTMNMDSSFANFCMLNHVVCYVPDCGGQTFWLDPTLEYAPLGWLPPHLENTFAVTLCDTGSYTRVIPSQDPEGNAVLSERVVNLRENGSAEVSGKTVFRGAPAVLQMKPMIRYSSPAQLDQLLQTQMLANTVGARDFEYRFAGQDSHDSGLIIDYSHAEEGYAQVAGNLLIVRPAVQPLSGIFDYAGHSPHRLTDLLLLGPAHYSFRADFVLPTGYRLSSGPPALTMQTEFLDYEIFTGSIQDGSLRIVIELAVKTNLVPSGKYREYRTVVDEMDANANQGLIFEKAD